MDFELYIPQARPQYNRRNGQFLKGHVPANKGVEGWFKSLPKKSQKRMAKGWKNLQKYRPTERPDTAGRCKKKIIAITDDKKFKIFEYSMLAAEWVHGERGNINRCCRFNQERHINKKTGKINTDHKYLGYRWYFYDDQIWWQKIE